MRFSDRMRVAHTLLVTIQRHAILKSTLATALVEQVGRESGVPVGFQDLAEVAEWMRLSHPLPDRSKNGD